MTAFLSPAWFAEQAATSLPLGPPELTIEQRVVGGPDGDVVYGLRVWADAVAVEAGAATNPDVTITEDYDTALAVHEGRMSAAAALTAGRIRIGGNITRLLDHAAALEATRG
ncbi:MAG TPA: SCP2 sterol-binding domain-containing protein [Acidimicrobiales bacterium]|nr:SCP2 sterol-binding domain-containing protein [Acidimicrobiales bacterium]